MLTEILTVPTHPANAGVNHTCMLTETELMIVSRWVDSNYQFYGSYYGRHHSRWVDPDPATATYDPEDYRRKASFEEAISKRAPSWYR